MSVNDFWLRWFDAIPETHDPNKTYEIGDLLKFRNEDGWDVYICMQRIGEPNQNIPLTDGGYWLMYGARKDGDTYVLPKDEQKEVVDEPKVETVKDYYKLNAIQKFFRRLFCSHSEIQHVRNIYGEEIIHSGYNRSQWTCVHCKKIVLRPSLHNV
jgi:hypothetical protein